MSDRWDWLAPVCRVPATNGGSVIIEETMAEGRAEVIFTAPPGWRLEKLSLERCAFAWLDEQLSADGILLARSLEGTWQAHVVECKRTVTEEKWRKVQRQLRGSCLRLLAVGGVLGLEIAKITLYTAFRRAKIFAHTPDFTSAMPRPGRIGMPEHFAQRLAWRASELVVDGFGPLEHRRLQLDDTGDDVGRAHVSLPPAT
jgi:hypothetical protein